MNPCAYLPKWPRYAPVNKNSILDVRTHFKPTETFQCTNLYSCHIGACHPPGVTKGFIKGEARSFSTRLKNRDYPATTVEKILSEVIFADRKKALEQRNKNASTLRCPTSRTYSWGNDTLYRKLYRTNHISETSLRNLPSFHIAKENP